MMAGPLMKIFLGREAIAKIKRESFTWENPEL
jgi:hypothetical protein